MKKKNLAKLMHKVIVFACVFAGIWNLRVVPYLFTNTYYEDIAWEELDERGVEARILEGEEIFDGPPGGYKYQVATLSNGKRIIAYTYVNWEDIPYNQLAKGTFYELSEEEMYLVEE